MVLRMKTVSYKRVAQEELMADVYPARRGKSPAVVFVHGGALIWGSRQDIRPRLLSLLHQNGYAVVSIDYRLAPTTKLHDILADVQDAMLWVKSGCAGTANIDPGRIAVFGSSAGGYLALSSGTFANSPNAIVAFYGYGNIAEDWYLKPSAFYLQQRMVSETEADACLGSNKNTSAAGFEKFPYYLYLRQKGIWPQTVTGREADELHEYCPEMKVDKQFPPTLLAHGTVDSDVPFECSVHMAGAIERAGKHVELYLLRNKDHAFDRDETDPEVVAIYERVIGFLSKRLQ